MTLSATDLELIRDEIGAAPDDATVQGYYTELADPSWIPTALRVLKRRRSDLAAAPVTSVNLPGGLGVGLGTPSLRSLDSQIARLERAYADLQTDDDGRVATSGRVQRQTYRSG